MAKFRPALLALLAVAMLMAPRPARAGKVGGTLARYGLAGAGVGALLGATSSTVPYLNDHQPFDFYVGAGAGALGGCLVGMIFGVVDLATDQSSPEGSNAQAKDSALFAFHAGTTTYLGWKTVF